MIKKGRKAWKRGKHKCKWTNKERRCCRSILSGVVGRRQESNISRRDTVNHVFTAQEQTCE